MVFVPLTRAEAETLRHDGLDGISLTGHAATPTLLDSHGYDASLLEDAEFAALCYAAVQAVLGSSEDPLRLVVAAELPPGQIVAVTADPYGQVAVRDLSWTAVQALFADEPEASAAVSAARIAARGRTVDEALAEPGVASLLEDRDLLWFAPEELDRLPVPPPDQPE